CPCQRPVLPGTPSLPFLTPSRASLPLYLPHLRPAFLFPPSSPNSSRHTRTTHSRACDQRHCPQLPPPDCDTPMARLKRRHTTTHAVPVLTTVQLVARLPTPPAPTPRPRLVLSLPTTRSISAPGSASTIPGWRRLYIRARHLVSQRTRRARSPPRSIPFHPSLLRSLPAACSLGRNAAIRTSLPAFLPASCICDAIAPSPS
ncbi:hypothetical protein DFH08DRAFT_1033722, partial [Mycena albidolilacea]